MLRTFTMTTMSCYRWHLSEGELTARVPGVDFSNGSKPIRVIQLTKTVLVVKIPGGSYWVGNYMPRHYAPAEFRVYGITTREGNIIETVEIAAIPVKS